MTLLRRANAGASGKEATNRDTNPYWITVNIKHRGDTYVEMLCWVIRAVNDLGSI